MSDAVQVAPSASLRAKNLVFAAIAVMAVYVLYNNESFLLNPANPVWQHYEPFKWWLLPHGLAGACALVRRCSSPTACGRASPSCIASPDASM